VILLDANLLIYAHAESTPQHRAARTWLDAQLTGTRPVGIPWPTALAFLRIVTNPRVFAHPRTIAQAWRQLTAWLDLDLVWIPNPGERHREVLKPLLEVGGVHGNLVPDAHLAALAIEHGLILCSTDSDFARFPTLRWANPIQA
jgi:toxin-antitoxin system PIN domain toxin